MAHRPTLDDSSWYFTIGVDLKSYDTEQNTITLIRSDCSVWDFTKNRIRERAVRLTNKSLNSEPSGLRVRSCYHGDLTTLELVCLGQNNSFTILIYTLFVEKTKLFS